MLGANLELGFLASRTSKFGADCATKLGIHIDGYAHVEEHGLIVSNILHCTSLWR